MALEFNKTTVSALISDQARAAFTMRDFSLQNLEKQTSSQILLRSGNFELANVVGMGQRKESMSNTCGDRIGG